MRMAIARRARSTEEGHMERSARRERNAMRGKVSDKADRHRPSTHDEGFARRGTAECSLPRRNTVLFKEKTREQATQ